MVLTTRPDADIDLLGRAFNAFAALIRTRPAPVSRRLLTMLYGLFDSALCSVGIDERQHDPFADRGDGLLVPRS